MSCTDEVFGKGNVGQRFPVPQAERGPQQLGRRFMAVRRSLTACFGGEADELVEVTARMAEPKHVARPASLDDALPPAAAKCRLSADTRMCTWPRADSGGESPHNASTRRSIGTSRPRFSRSMARTARSRGPPTPSSWPSAITVSGPRSWKSISLITVVLDGQGLPGIERIEPTADLTQLGGQCCQRMRGPGANVGGGNGQVQWQPPPQPGQRGHRCGLSWQPLRRAGMQLRRDLVAVNARASRNPDIASAGGTCFSGAFRRHVRAGTQLPAPGHRHPRRDGLTGRTTAATATTTAADTLAVSDILI